MKLNVFSSLPLFDNVAINRPFSEAIELQELVLHKLASGIAIFFYTKKDGTLRPAVGTLKEDLIRTCTDHAQTSLETMVVKLFEVANMFSQGKADNKETVNYWERSKNKLVNMVDAIKEKLLLKEQRQKKTRKISEINQPYFDLQEMAWKSYTKDSLVAIIDIDSNG